MSLTPSDSKIISMELNRDPTSVEVALFENLWSEHCSYRSSKSLLSKFDSDYPHVVVGPGDDAAVIEITKNLYVAIGIESHNHPSFVAPYDGAATGVGGIVRDVISMGAYPIALTNNLYFGEFSEEHTRYLLEGVVNGISSYGNAIGVPTIAGSVDFHPKYSGNPLVNVGCVGILTPNHLTTAAAKTSGNYLVLVGSSTGKDGLGGASFASEDLSETAETDSRSAVQVGDPYAEKLLIEMNQDLISKGLVSAARDLGAAGLGGATSEMVGKSGFGAVIELSNVHIRETNMGPIEILLAESQERMCYEVSAKNIDSFKQVVGKYDLDHSVIGKVTSGNYICKFHGDVVVDVPASLILDGAPSYIQSSLRRSSVSYEKPLKKDIKSSFEGVISNPNSASKSWIYQQYDRHVGARSIHSSGSNTAVMSLPGSILNLAISTGSNPRWTSVDPYMGSQSVVLDAATDLATVAALPLAMVDCLNAGNPETPEVFYGFENIVNGIVDICAKLKLPVVGGNVSLYNDSINGSIPPTPTVMMIGKTSSTSSIPPNTFSGAGSILLVGDIEDSLGGSVYLHEHGGNDNFHSIILDPLTRLKKIAELTQMDSTLSIHDVGDGGIATTLSEMVSKSTGASINLQSYDTIRALFNESPGRVIVESTDPKAVESLFNSIAPVYNIGNATNKNRLDISTSSTNLSYSTKEITILQDIIAQTMDS